MKLVKVGSFLTLLLVIIATIVVMILLSEITYTISDHARGFWDDAPRPGLRPRFDSDGWGFDSNGWGFDDGWVEGMGDNYRWVWSPYKPSAWITPDGDPSVLTYLLTFVISLVVGSILFFPPYIRARNIELGLTNEKSLIYVWGVLYFLSGSIISAVLLFIGAIMDKGDVYNSEITYREDRRIYDGPRREREMYDRNTPSNDLVARLRYLEEELDGLEKRSRDNRYDIDDEFDYTHRRNNRKFRDIEDEIDDLHDRLDRRQRRY